MNAFDIETIPNQAMVEFMIEPEVALGNLKDPEKIKEKIAEAKAKAIDRMALSPLYGRVYSASFYGKTIQEYRVIPEISDAAEIELLNYIFENISLGGNDAESPKIITWNGLNFDFPFIYKRAALLRVALPVGCPGLKYWTQKYRSDVHCDLMQELCSWNIQDKISLDVAGKIFLGEGKTKRDYSTYVSLIESGQGNLIGLDNLCDTKLTFDLYNLLSPYLF